MSPRKQKIHENDIACYWAKPICFQSEFSWQCSFTVAMQWAPYGATTATTYKSDTVTDFIAPSDGRFRVAMNISFYKN